MLHHAFKIALRFLTKRKGLSFIHLFGLTSGIAVFWIIIQYVSFEKSYDQFHSKADQVYRIDIDFYRDGEQVDGDAMNYPATGPAMVDELTEVIDFVRITPSYGNNIFSKLDVLVEETKVYYADSSLFNIFDYKFLEGSPQSALEGTNKLVLTRTLAEKLFGPYGDWRSSPIGQVIKLNNYYDLMISAIVDDPPINTHLRAAAFVSFATFEKETGDLSSQWGWNDFYTYVLTVPGTTKSEFQSKMTAFVDSHMQQGHGNIFVAKPITEIHLYSHQSDEPEINGDATTVYALTLVAFIILVIAWINYINLSTARSEERAREVGVRKVNGASKSGLVIQFLSESFVLNSLAIFLSLLLAYLILPLLSGLLPEGLTFNLIYRRDFWVGVLILLVGGTILSGLYPAFVISSYTPGYILKGSAQSRDVKEYFRKGLVVFQFTAAIGLLIGTIVIHNQTRYMQTKTMGFDKNDKLVIKAPVVYHNDSVFRQKYLTFKNELLQTAGVEQVTISSAVPGGNLEYEVNVRMLKVDGQDNKAYRRTWQYYVDYDFVDTYNLDIMAGKNFSKRSKSQEVVVNRSAAKLFGFLNPADLIGKKFTDFGGEIVGVVEDYHHQSVKMPYLPMVMVSNLSGMQYYTVNLNTKSMEQTKSILSNLQERWAKVYPENPFSYFFLQDRIDYQYKAEWRLGTVLFGFAVLAVLITCLGLFGLSSYMVITRTKEIGIRKVLGANRGEIVFNLSREFIYLLGISSLIALPIGFYLFSTWLNDFAWHIDISWWLLSIPVVLVSLVSLLIVASHSFKAASINPVNALRNE